MHRSFLICILLLASALRLLFLGSIPSHPNPDEVSNGYNAYSLLKTGADEYGHRMPILIQAFNDWRPGIFVYFTVPFIAVFGLNMFAVRLPSVVLSLGTLVFLYFLTKLFLEHSREAQKNINLGKIKISIKELIPLFTVLLFAITPWTINVSRLSHEVNLSLFFLVSGLYFFYSFIKTRKIKYIVFSGLIFALCINSYNATKLFLPFFIAGLVLLNRKEILLQKKIFIIGVFIFFLAMLPTLYTFLQPKTLTRFEGTSIFSQSEDVKKISAQRFLRDKESGNLFGMIVDNRRIGYLLASINNYLETLNPAWLFTERHIYPLYKVPQFGSLYLFSLPLLLLGIYTLIKYPIFSNRFNLILLLLITTSIMPSVFTIHAPHIIRTFHLVVPLIIIQAVGASSLVGYPFKRKYQAFFCVLFFAFSVFYFLWFVHAYFFTFKHEPSLGYQEQVMPALSYVQSLENKYQRIVVSTTGNLPQAYIYYLFLTKYDPATYIKNKGTKSGSFNDSHVIGKYEFKPLSFTKSANGMIVPAIANDTLFVLSQVDINNFYQLFSENFIIIKTFNLYTGEPAIVLAAKSKK